MSFQIKCVTNLEEAKKVWKLLTPNDTIFDTWDFRYCFYKYFNYPLEFYIGYDGDEPVGVLPLQFNNEKGHLEFFGGSYMDNNKAFIKPDYKTHLPNFFKNLSKKTLLEYLDGTDPLPEGFEQMDHKFIIPLEGLKTYDDFLEKFVEKKFAKKLREKVRQVQRSEVEIADGTPSDIELLFEYNKKRFDDSSFSFPHREEIFRDLLKLPFQIYLKTYRALGKIQAVSLAIGYKNHYLSMNSGINQEEIKNLTTFVQLKKIDDAIKNNYQIFDAGSSDLGWKEHWGLTKIPQYKFEK